MKLKVKDGRGQHVKDQGIVNRELVEQWFKNNPNSTQKECKESTGFSLVTIRKHLKALGL